MAAESAADRLLLTAAAVGRTAVAAATAAAAAAETARIAVAAVPASVPAAVAAAVAAAVGKVPWGGTVAAGRGRLRPADAPSWHRGEKGPAKKACDI